MKPLIIIITLALAATSFLGQKAAGQNNNLPSYPQLPAELLVEPPSHYLEWECDSSLEDQSLFFTEYTRAAIFFTISSYTIAANSALNI
jgi:hypothetical protein